MASSLRITTGSADPAAVSNTTRSAPDVGLARTVAIRVPSGDQVGNPKVPFATSARGVERPSAPTMDNDPSAARIAIEPLDAIGPVNAADELGDAEPGGSLVTGDGPTVALATGFPDGAGSPHAATANTAAQPRSAMRLID